MSARRPHAPASGGRAGRPGGPSSSGARPTAHRPGVRATGAARPATGGVRASSGTARSAPARAPAARAEAATTSLPGLFTVRALVLFVVSLVAFVLLFPTVKAYLAQKSDNERLVQQVSQAKEQNDNLAAELQRWDDPAYVAAQARERLAFVLPGETAFRVVDPEVVPDPTAPAVAAAGDGPALVPAGTTTPWYTTIWDSVQVAGAADAPADADDAGTLPAQQPGSSTAPSTSPSTGTGSTAPASTAPASNGTP